MTCVKIRGVRDRYLIIFTTEGIAVGILLYIGLRQTIRHFFDVSGLIPQIPYVGIVANIIGLGVVLPLVVLVTITVVKRLGLDRV